MMKTIEKKGFYEVEGVFKVFRTFIDEDGNVRTTVRDKTPEEVAAQALCPEKSPSGRETCTLGKVGHEPFKDGTHAIFAHAIPERGIGWGRL